ncbi:MAG: GNAT family N-acetyltransferase, partial [Thermoplasmata archaeon]
DPASARIAGHAYYRVLRARGGPSRAVVGIEVEDGFQGRGIGSRLLEALAEEARHRRLDRLTATVHPDNGRSRRLFHRCGYAEVGRSVPPVGGRRRVPEIPYEKPLRTE